MRSGGARRRSSHWAALAPLLGFAVLFAVIGRQFRRQAEQNAKLTETAEALRASEARVRDFAEMSSDWFWEQDANLRFTWISDSRVVAGIGMTRTIAQRRDGSWPTAI